jgi:CCR4-NOT transcription complex subunit 1
MRNVILSAFPRSMRLPDPSTPNLKVGGVMNISLVTLISAGQYLTMFLVYLWQIDLLPEITKAPRIMSDFEGALRSKHMKADVDEYLKVIELTCWYPVLSKAFISQLC